MHSHHNPYTEKRLLIAISITGFIFLAELLGGFWTGSLALMSDAAHVFLDVFALLLSFFALRLSPDSGRPAYLRLPPAGGVGSAGKRDDADRSGGSYPVGSAAALGQPRTNKICTYVGDRGSRTGRQHLCRPDLAGGKPPAWTNHAPTRGS
jgi:hypothetical protein